MHNSQFNGSVNDNASAPSTDYMLVAKSDIGTRERYEEYRRKYEAEQVLSIKDIVRMGRRWAWLILLVAILFAGVAGGFSVAQKPTYEASAKMLISAKGEGGSVGDLQNEILGLQQIAITMTEAIQTRPIAQAALRRANSQVSPETFLANLSVAQVSTTQFIEVYYMDTDPAQARLMANSTAEVFSEQISNISPSASNLTARVWEPAMLPEFPVSPDPIRNILLALALGLLVGAGLAFVLESLGERWGSPEEAERFLGVRSLGSIPDFKIRKSEET